MNTLLLAALLVLPAAAQKTSKLATERAELRKELSGAFARAFALWELEAAAKRVMSESDPNEESWRYELAAMTVLRDAPDTLKSLTDDLHSAAAHPAKDAAAHELAQTLLKELKELGTQHAETLKTAEELRDEYVKAGADQPSSSFGMMTGFSHIKILLKDLPKLDVTDLAPEAEALVQKTAP